MNYILVDEYTDLHGREIVICDFDPSSDMITKVRDQWQRLPNGNIRVWMERAVLDDMIDFAVAADEVGQELLQEKEMELT